MSKSEEAVQVAPSYTDSHVPDVYNGERFQAGEYACELFQGRAGNADRGTSSVDDDVSPTRGEMYQRFHV